MWALRWCDVDPATHPFDARPAREIAERLLLGTLLPPASDDPTAPADPRLHELEDAIDAAWIAEYGSWAAGWRWGASEPGSGGPVHAYCCATHSLRDPDRSADVVVAALCEWRQWLEALAARFTDIRRENENIDVAEATDRAAARLLSEIVERTDASDAWYGTFETVMGWCLEPLVADDRERARLIQDAIGGRFESWLAPSTEIAREVTAAIGSRTASALASPAPVRDALEEWLAVRANAWPTDGVHALREAREDGHLAYVRKHDAARDPLRAERMADAIALARQAAVRRDPLDVASLCRWHSVVLGDPVVTIRTTDAYAKGGRERYGTPPDLEAKLASFLAEACRDDEPASTRAARVYLDVLFLHPFRDGNARAARIALDYVLTRAGLALDAAEPIFIVSRTALDAYGPFQLAHLVDRLKGTAPLRA